MFLLSLKLVGPLAPSLEEVEAMLHNLQFALGQESMQGNEHVVRNGPAGVKWMRNRGRKFQELSGRPVNTESVVLYRRNL